MGAQPSQPVYDPDILKGNRLALSLSTITNHLRHYIGVTNLSVITLFSLI
jgi:hypothetical protein